MIERFRGDYFFLSNMYPLRTPIITSQGLEVLSSEHAWQAGKFDDPSMHEQIAETVAPDDQPRWRGGVIAKNRAHVMEAFGVPVVNGYRDPAQRILIMGSIIRMKFTWNPELAGLLLATGEQELVEGNSWGDREWGVSPIGSEDGENHLGKLLMAERDRIRQAL